MFSSIIERLKKKRQRRISIQKTIILIFPIFLISFLLISLISFNFVSEVSGYSIIVDNSVDADSDIDSTANIGDDGTTSYLQAQSKDGVYQNITEGQGAGYIAGTNVEDFTDANTDTQSPTDLGTYSDFSESQDNDGVYNTLTEENDPLAGGSEWLDCDAWDGTQDQLMTYVGADPYLSVQDQPTNYVWSLSNGAQTGWYDFPVTTLTGTLAVNISIYCNNDDGSGNDRLDVMVDYTGSGGGADVGDAGQHTAWQYDTFDLGTHTVAEVNALRVWFDYSFVGSKDDVRIDHVRIGISVSGAGDNYRFDREFSFTNLDFDELDGEELCIYVNTAGTETLDIDVWESSAWVDVGINIVDANDGMWVNISISTWLDASTEYFRFEDATTTGDTTQSSWILDGILIHSWSDDTDDYELQWEHQTQDIDIYKDYYDLTIFGYDPVDWIPDPTGKTNGYYLDSGYGYTELNASRGQTSRHWYNESSGEYTFSSDYLVNKTGVIDNTNWITSEEYPYRFVIRLINGSLYLFEDPNDLTSFFTMIDNSTLWAVGYETPSGVFGFYLNFQDINWGHAQYLYWTRLKNGQISAYNQPLYAIYPHLYANYSGVWYDKLLNDRSLYDTPSKNPRNNLHFFNDSGNLGVYFTTYDIDILSSNWDFEHGFKYSFIDEGYHLITRMRCKNQDFDDIAMTYEITSSPQSDNTPYQPDRFRLSNSTHEIEINISQAWEAGTYLKDFYSQIEIVSQNNESFRFTFDDMEEAGFTEKYLNLHEQMMPNGIIRKILRAGMYGFGSYDNDTTGWIEIDPTITELKIVDNDDVEGYDNDPQDGIIDGFNIARSEWSYIGFLSTIDFQQFYNFDTDLVVGVESITSVSVQIYSCQDTMEAGEGASAQVYNVRGNDDSNQAREDSQSWDATSYEKSELAVNLDPLGSFQYITLDTTKMESLLNYWANVRDNDDDHVNFRFYHYLADYPDNDWWEMHDSAFGSDYAGKITFTYVLTPSENISLQIWNHTQNQWDSLNTNITDTEQWYNVSFDKGYVDISNQWVTWRYIGTNETGDDDQNTLHIDYSGVRAYNFSVYGLPDTFDSLEFSPDSSYHAFIDSPLEFVVESGRSYDVQIKGTDIIGTSVVSGFIYYNSIDDTGTAIVLTTSYVNFYNDQLAGNNTHYIYLWVNWGWSGGDSGVTGGTRSCGIDIQIISD